MTATPTVLGWPAVLPAASCIHVTRRRAVYADGDRPTHLIECSACRGVFGAVIT